jgi:hypothetical protein
VTDAAFWAEADELINKARRFKPIPVPLEGQCVRDSVAVVLGRDPEELPPRLEGQHITEWVAEVERRFNVKIEFTLRKNLPPPEPEKWVANVPCGDEFHAIPMLGARPLRDGAIYPYPMLVATGGLRIVANAYDIEPRTGRAAEPHERQGALRAQRGVSTCEKTPHDPRRCRFSPLGNA